MLFYLSLVSFFLFSLVQAVEISSIEDFTNVYMKVGTLYLFELSKFQIDPSTPMDLSGLEDPLSSLSSRCYLLGLMDTESKCTEAIGNLRSLSTSQDQGGAFQADFESKYSLLFDLSSSIIAKDFYINPEGTLTSSGTIEDPLNDVYVVAKYLALVDIETNYVGREGHLEINIYFSNTGQHNISIGKEENEAWIIDQMNLKQLTVTAYDPPVSNSLELQAGVETAKNQSKAWLVVDNDIEESRLDNLIYAISSFNGNFLVDSIEFVFIGSEPISFYPKAFLVLFVSYFPLMFPFPLEFSF